jgi:hypothetical protein
MKVVIRGNDNLVDGETVAGLPDGAGPVQYINDFGDTPTLMLTVSSPPVSSMEISLRARQIQLLIERIRQESQSTARPSLW